MQTPANKIPKATVRREIRLSPSSWQCRIVTPPKSNAAGMSIYKSWIAFAQPSGYSKSFNWNATAPAISSTVDDETQIYFKVMEYKTKHNVSLQGLLNLRDNEEFIPIHPSRIPDITE
jgi:hypothetical protein